jgi:ferredoxin
LTTPIFLEKSENPVAESNPLVIFTPSGKRGHFPVGTPVLTAARQLGVDLDSVCGGRGICSKCQVAPAYGDFPKHGVTVAADALSDWNAVEERYDRVRGLQGRRLGCQATVQATSSSTCPPKARSTARSCARPPPLAPSPWTRPRASCSSRCGSRTCTNPPAISNA